MNAKTERETGMAIVAEAYHFAIAEQARLAAVIAEIEWLCDGRVDIDDNGGPNLAMQIMQAIKGETP